MKRIYQIALFISFVILSSCADNSTNEIPAEHQHHPQKTYTCPMHPEIIKNEPGKCPICGMTLVEKSDKGNANKNNDLEILLKPTNEFVIADIKTISPSQMELPLTIEATGKINYDTREINTISARVSGWIEKLYIKYRYQPIYKGQKLFDIYSKELVTEQENLIFLVKNDSENKPLIDAAEKRLALEGLTNSQIEEIKKTGKTIRSISIYSSYSGHLHENNEFSEIVTGSMSGMETVTESKTELNIKEGTHVDKGQNIFSIYSTERVWAVLNIPNEFSDQVQQGLPVTISTGETNEISGKIDFIVPALDKEQKTISARIYLPNKKNKLRIGMIINAKLDAGNKKGIFIPSASVVHLGINDVVFVKEQNLFRSKIITTGITINGHVEVISGITEKDKIAENAQMLMDSESFIKTGYEK